MFFKYFHDFLSLWEHGNVVFIQNMEPKHANGMYKVTASSMAKQTAIFAGNENR